MSRHALRPRAPRRGPRPPAGTFSLDSWPDSEGDEDLKQLAGVYHEEAFDAAALGEPKCAVCGAAAEKRCSKCHNEWYCGRECQLKAWKGHKALCKLVSQDRARGGAAGGAGGARVARRQQRGVSDVCAVGVVCNAHEPFISLHIESTEPDSSGSCC